MVKIHGSLDILQLLSSPEYKEVTKTSVDKTCDRISKTFMLYVMLQLYRPSSLH